MSSADTPLMQQYRDIKSRHRDAILFFRMGEFYEMFYEDAEVASRLLGLTLTSRNNGGAADVPLAGIPVKAASDYLRRLVGHGHRVAICEQMEDPRLAKGIVRREVIETISPGVAFADDLLDSARNNFVCAVLRARAGRVAGRLVGAAAPGDNDAGVAAADVSTGELLLFMTRSADLESLLARLSPREILVPSDSADVSPPSDTGAEGALVTAREPWEFDPPAAAEDLARQFGVHSLEGLGLEARDALAVGAAGALLRYLRELQPSGLPQLARPIVERGGGVMPLDEMTRRNLELVESLRSSGERGREGVDGTLISVLDRTQTPMGARLLRQWLLAPLTNREAIDARLEAVSELVADALARQRLLQALDGVRDVERLAAKAAAGRSSPREVGALGTSLARLPEVADAVRRLMPAAHGASRRSLLVDLMESWDDCGDVAADIRGSLVERPPIAIGDETTIAAGVDSELDELRATRDGGKDAIVRIQAAERERTGIASLKVGFNKVFGYYIEVTKTNLHLVPADYQRRQTITTGERYVTPALKEHEERVVNAAEGIEHKERELFERLRAGVGSQIARLQCVAGALARVDVVAALAEVAAREAYVRPELTEDFVLHIDGGRHPVVERMMPRDRFIPNDLDLAQGSRMMVLTGPNMAGKSTILRQVGLIVVMAQMGSFVPARAARIGIVDRVFTRVGASDNLVRGQSTFMVEMAETSAILHAATAQSLVLLDEIGRGTSTYDGVSIAWAVSEHLHERTKCKTIFATHYHELTQLAQELDAVRNFNVAVRELGDSVLFLHKLTPGGADRSYGIEVGRLAGLPDSVIARARRVLSLFEGEQLVSVLRNEPTPAQQLPLFSSIPHPALQELQALDVNHLSPLEALTTLARLADTARKSAS